MAQPWVVDANYRFIAAYQEVNARIQQRQQALALYVTLVVSLLAALVALKPDSHQLSLPIEWLMLGFPVASLSFVLLNYKAERAITNLRHFLSALERLNNAHELLPSYNTDPKWSSNANQARRFHDLAAVVLVAGGNTLGLGATLKIYPERMANNYSLLLASLALAGLSLFILWRTPQWSYKPN